MPTPNDAIEKISQNFSSLNSKIKALEATRGSRIIVKETTGLPAAGRNGNVVINTVDETIHLYGGGGWILLGSSSQIIPAEPTITATAMIGSWRLTWPAVSGATKYRIYKNTVGVDGGAVEVTITESTILDVPYDDGYIYFAGTSIGNNESDIGPWATDTSNPANPSWSGHAYTTGGHMVQWYHSNRAIVDEFVIYRNTSGVDGGATEVATVDGATAVYIIPYAAGGDYFGIKAVGYSDLESSIVWTAQEYDPTPSTPTLTASMVEFGGFVMSWNAIDGAIRYEVQGAQDGSGTGAILVWSGSTIYTPTIAKTGIKYFRIRALGYDGTYSDYSSWTTDTQAPPQPTITVYGNLDNITISIASTDTSHTSIGFSHYVVEQADDGSGTGATTIDSHALYSAFPYVVPQASGDTKYYRVTPYDWAGNAGTATAWTGCATYVPLGQTIKDLFDGYGGDESSPLDNLYWLRIAQFDGLEAIYDSFKATLVTSPRLEGQYSTEFDYTGVSSWYMGVFDKIIDLSVESRFTSGDYVVAWIYPDATYGSTTATIMFIDASWDEGESIEPAFYKNFTVVKGQWNLIAAKKSEFSIYGSPSWDNIGWIQVIAGTKFYVDDMRLSKADPDDADDYNDTGYSWDKASSSGSDYGEWHIYEGNRVGEPGKPFSYGQLVSAASPSVWQLSHKPLESTDISVGTLQAGVYVKDDDGAAGLAFFISDTTSGSWDMYAIEADSDADTITLAKWVAGTRSQISQVSFTFAPNETLWLGADFRDFDADAGRIRVYASLTEGNLIQASNLIMSEQDASLNSGGSVGLLSYQANCRFVSFVAGSPAHAETADVSRSLDGPILDGGTSVDIGYDSGLRYSVDNKQTWQGVSDDDHGHSGFSKITTYTFSFDQSWTGDSGASWQSTNFLISPTLIGGTVKVSVNVAIQNSAAANLYIDARVNRGSGTEYQYLPMIRQTGVCSHQISGIAKFSGLSAGGETFRLEIKTWYNSRCYMSTYPTEHVGTITLIEETS